MNDIIRPETGQYINMKSLSDIAYARLEDLCEKTDWHPITPTQDPEKVLLLIERLRHCKDDSELFPKGKWATIQRLEQIFEADFYQAMVRE